MASTKNIRFDYFKPCLEDDSDTEVNLLPYIEMLHTIPFEARVMPYTAGHSIRLSHTQYHANYQPDGSSPFPFPLWQLIFTRMRPDVPGVTKRTLPDLTPLDLEDDEYIAEDTTVLYDSTINYLIIQRNRTGAPPSVIQDFFNGMHDEGQSAIELQIITKTNPLERALQHRFHHSFNVRIKNIRNPAFENAVGNNQTLNNVIHIGRALSTEQEYPVQAELILKIPTRNPENTFKNSIHTGILNVLNPLIASDIVDKLIIRGRNDEESALEEVDLVQDVLREWIKFNLENSRLIPSPSIFDRLAYSYAQRRPNLLPTP
ncbi:MAG: hypothetical protein K0S24_4911 [Sphingobacterium sp.]|nr:hypothetical protein [Sphingobacterium sp.]